MKRNQQHYQQIPIFLMLWLSFGLISCTHFSGVVEKGIAIQMEKLSHPKAVLASSVHQILLPFPSCA